ncbi:MAG: glutamate--cysteine ligase [Actinomycetota bacterium]|nr:glutamate--cysteine ligase [Actinomycetota bacterium]
MEINFGASAPYTVGVEEEFQLVDPTSLALVPAVGTVLAARDAAAISANSVVSELLASFLEVRSPVCGTVTELAAKLPVLRREVRDLVEGCGVRLAAAGAHPFSEAITQPVTADERYRRVEEEMGWAARMQAIYGLHVHVAVPDRERAIRAVATLARHVPLFIALSANSPFWQGYDTRFASARVEIFGLLPRSGLPPYFRRWEDFESHVNTLVNAGSIPDYSWCWWDVRPHSRIGTVELRAPDAQTDANRTASLAALAQCLVANADQFPAENPLLTEENKWRVTRYGLDAQLHDFSTGRSIPASDAARTLVERLRPVAQDLGCEAELEGVLEIVESGTGAERQRAVLGERGTLKGVVEHLIEATA